MSPNVAAKHRCTRQAAPAHVSYRTLVGHLHQLVHTTDTFLETSHKTYPIRGPCVKYHGVTHPRGLPTGREGIHKELHPGHGSTY